jgi:hypothetical protein
MTINPVSFFFTPFGETPATITDSMETFAQGSRVFFAGLRAVTDELGRFATERLQRHMSVSSALFAGLWPAGAIAQMTEYMLESAEAWDEEQTRLAGILADALTESFLAEEVIGRVLTPDLPYSPWLDSHDGEPSDGPAR